MNVTAIISRRADDLRVVCPHDEWSFAPRYTDGVCPLCGWEPVGVDVKPPLLSTIDWFVPVMVMLALASVVMTILVVIAYTH